MSAPRDKCRRLSSTRAAWLAALVAAVAVLALPSAASAYVYWANEEGDTIARASLDGSGTNPSFLTGASAPGGVAVDGTHIYWTNEGANAIGRANLDGSDRLPNFITGAKKPIGIAVDGNFIYWTNGENSTIGRANLDGSGVNQSFVTGLGVPLSMAVDGAHIYWVNFSVTNSIGRANLNGSSVNQSFITGTSFPRGVAVDGSHLYWTNYQNSTIGRANLNGTGVNQSFMSGGLGHSLYGVAVDGSSLYWSDSEGGTIGRANLDGSGPSPTFITGADSPAGLAVDGLPAAASGPPAGAPSAAPSKPKPSNAFKLLKSKLNKGAGTALLTVKPSSPGKFVLSGKGVKKVSKRTTGKVTLTVRPQAKTAKALAANREAAVVIKLTFTPNGGEPRSKTVKLTLKLTA